MKDNKTSSMLQRVPVILAVTAASYGLQLPPSVQRSANAGPATVHVAHSQPLERKPADA